MSLDCGGMVIKISVQPGDAGLGLPVFDRGIASLFRNGEMDAWQVMRHY
jgi:hypothetical protein